MPDVPSLCSQPNHSTAWEPSKGTVPPWDIDHNGEWGTPSANVATRALGPRQRERRRSPDHSPSFLLFCFSFFATPWTIKEVAGPPVQGITTNLTTDLHTSETYEAFPPNIDPCQVTQATLNFPPEPVYILVFCLHTIQDRHTIHNH